MLPLKPKMPHVLKSPSAESDLDEIWLYIALDNLDIADRFIDELNDQCESLAEFPEMGKACDELAPDLRMFPVDNYLIFYRPVEDGVDIVRVIHGARGIEDLF